MVSGYDNISMNKCVTIMIYKLAFTFLTIFYPKPPKSHSRHMVRWALLLVTMSDQQADIISRANLAVPNMYGIITHY